MTGTCSLAAAGRCTTLMAWGTYRAGADQILDGVNHGPFGERALLHPEPVLALRSGPGAVLAAWSWVMSSRSTCWSTSQPPSALVAHSRRRASRGCVSAWWQDLPQGRSQGGLLRGQGEPAATAEAGEGAQAAARGAAVRVIAVRPVANTGRDPAA